MKSFFDKLFKLPVYIHILAVILLSCLTVFTVMRQVDVYTNHNQAVTVPDVRGLQIEDAAPFFEKNMLRFTVIDSVYMREKTPGAIIELMPEANSKVKKKRIVYVTVNAKTEETAVIPDHVDISFRQALALLKSQGFKDVEWKYITGEYKDLTVGVEYGGQMVKSGTRVPLRAKLILVVSDGNIHSADSSALTGGTGIIEGDESWF